MNYNPALVVYAIFLILGGIGQLLGMAYISTWLPEHSPAIRGWRLFFFWTSGALIASGIGLFIMDGGGIV